MTIPDVNTITTEDQARQLAIDWQDWQATEDLSWGELSDWHGFFTQLADKFGLTDEFEENGIRGERYYMTQQITILRTAYPEPDTPMSDCAWLLQWSDHKGTHTRWFVEFADLSAYVEGVLLC